MDEIGQWVDGEIMMMLAPVLSRSEPASFSTFSKCCSHGTTAEKNLPRASVEKYVCLKYFIF